MNLCIQPLLGSYEIKNPISEKLMALTKIILLGP